MWRFSRVLSTLPGYSSQFFDLPFLGEPPSGQKPKVVVVGSGWAGHAFVSGVDRSMYDVRVVSEREGRLNQPHMISLWKATHTASPVPVTVDTCVSIDVDKKRVVGKKGGYVYDYVVVATGSEPNTFGLPGVAENCLMCKTDTDLDRLQSALKAGDGVTVLGAGPTGVELACKLKSLGHPVKIVEGGSTVLPGFSPGFQTTVLGLLADKGIWLLMEQKITGVTSTAIQTQAGDVPDTNRKVWTCGVRPTALFRELKALGPVDSCLRLGGRSDVFAIGDCAGRPTAQSARQQGTYLAHQFNRRFSGDAFEYKELGRIVDLEDRFVVEVGGFVFTMSSALRPVIHWFTR